MGSFVNDLNLVSVGNWLMAVRVWCSWHKCLLTNCNIDGMDLFCCCKCTDGWNNNLSTWVWLMLEMFHKHGTVGKYFVSLKMSISNIFNDWCQECFHLEFIDICFLICYQQNNLKAKIITLTTHFRESKTINRGTLIGFPDSKVHWANMGPTWVLSAPDGPHVGPMNLAIRVCGQQEAITSSHHKTDPSWHMVPWGPNQLSHLTLVPHMSCWIKLSLVLIVVCHLFSAKLLSIPVMNLDQSHIKKQTLNKKKISKPNNIQLL